MDNIYTKRNKKEKKKIGRRIILPILLLLILFAGFKGCQYTVRSIKGMSIIKVKEIKVKGPSNIDSQEIITLSGIKKGDSIFGTSISLAKDKISKHKWVKYVRIRRSLPSTLIIDITPKKVGALALAHNSVYYVDDSGKIMDVFTPGYETDHPVIISKPGYYPKILATIEQLRKLEPISELQLEQDVITVRSAKFPMRIGLDINEIDKGLSKAFRVIKDIEEKGETASTVDASLPGNRIVVIGLRKN